MKRIALLSITLLASPVFSQNEHSGMNHAEHMKTMSTPLSMPKITLTEAGNDAFGTIQEVITKLNSDPNTNWEQVNIEALRLHLLDMTDMTINVEVLSQKPIENGMVAVIKPTTARAEAALDRVFNAHPAQLEKETGWKMTIAKKDKQYTVTTITSNPKEVAKVRGLGYIGLMANGNHHQPHHWMMATGANPHAHSH